jgi:hypothetical protein
MMRDAEWKVRKIQEVVDETASCLGPGGGSQCARVGSNMHGAG